MAPDLIATAAEVVSGHRSAAEAFAACVACADTAANANTFVRRFDRFGAAAAAAIDLLRSAGAPLPPLAGLAVSVKDLFDVAGQPTSAGSRVLADAPPAVADAAVVARLRAAGAALIGHTNMTEFAFSGVGINPHHGTPPNPGTAALDATPRIPGGSTSGGAVSVATGAAWAALGSDTGGSIRIPAALMGLVGFKNTQALTPLAGSIALAPSLDTACAMTLSVRDAVLLHEVLAARTLLLLDRAPSSWRLALPRTVMLDGLQAPVSAAFERAVQTLRGTGMQIEEIDLPELDQLAALNAGGGIVVAESWAVHRTRLSRHEALYDPRVAQRIRRGEALSAADYIDLLRAREQWILRTGERLAAFDAAISPTVPMLAPPLQPLVDDTDQFFRCNALLLRNPSVVNFFDGCALSLPCHAAGAWPVGLMLWAGAGRDDTLLSLGLMVERMLASMRQEG
jgi:aspartyl-tRNA(Asn)/glutamyl-tRNA(Gln) amidotransferase subunit A